MKTVKILILALVATASVFTAKADDDRPISIGQLPAKSQQFIQAHFNGIDVSYAKLERDLIDKSYEVRFVNGAKVEFEKNGDWSNVDCHREKVPTAIVPAQIQEYVSRNHPNRMIVKIDRDRRDYEIELDNEMEIKFNTRFQVIGYDD